MTFAMTTQGPGWRLAGSLITLGSEVSKAHPDFTCLGTIGDAAHVGEGVESDHNPFVLDPHTGIGIVRAIDIGGPDAELKQLRAYLWNLYAESDNRLYEFGYVKGCSDNLINNWGLPFNVHIDTGDAGHLHISVTQTDGNHPSAAGYVAAIDDPRTWGITPDAVTPAGGNNPASPSWPAENFLYPFTGSDHFGDILGPKTSHGGDTRFDGVAVIADIRQIQGRLNQLGFGPIAVDGEFGPHTIAAATAFQHRYRPANTTLWGQLWADDCRTLFGTITK